VKNLENVQGDERDVIYISTVYGKDENGNFYQRFGPINGTYGHRRLNVLFTRAKKRVTVFTSMLPEDIQDEGKHPGVGVLKRYLQYARDGMAVSTISEDEECESEFERWGCKSCERTCITRCHKLASVATASISQCGIQLNLVYFSVESNATARHTTVPVRFAKGIG
jgi:hypothetical protein